MWKAFVGGRPETTNVMTGSIIAWNDLTVVKYVARVDDDVGEEVRMDGRLQW